MRPINVSNRLKSCSCVNPSALTQLLETLSTMLVLEDKKTAAKQE